jgi:hypothetical protein
MLCETTDPTLTEFIRAEFRGDKRGLKLMHTFFGQPAMSVVATALGNLLLESEDNPWTEPKTYIPILVGYPFVCAIFMGTCVAICNSKREKNENPYRYLNGSRYDKLDKISWDVELTLSKIHCEPYGTVASALTITTWSTFITPTAALLGNMILNGVPDREATENILTANALGGLIVGAVPGTFAILYKLFKQKTLQCCPESGRYVYKLSCNLPRGAIDTDLDDFDRIRFPSFGTLTPFSSNPSTTPNGTAITPIGRISYTRVSTTPVRDLTASFDYIIAKQKAREKKRREENLGTNRQWLLLQNN